MAGSGACASSWDLCGLSLLRGLRVEPTPVALEGAQPGVAVLLESRATCSSRGCLRGNKAAALPFYLLRGLQVERTPERRRLFPGGWNDEAQG